MDQKVAHILDVELEASDVQALSGADATTAFFARLGYSTDARTLQTPANLGMTADSIVRPIKRIELIADQEGLFQIYLVEFTSVTVAHTRALARSFRNRAGNYLLVLTSDYEQLDIVLLERYLPSGSANGTTLGQRQVGIRPHVLTIERRKPSQIDLRVLRRLTWTESDAFAQYDKLLSAYAVADWSEEFFNNRALFSDYYLLKRLPERPQWVEDPKPSYIRLRQLYQGAAARFAGKERDLLLRELMEPVLQALGFDARPGKKLGSRVSEPDYRLYAPAQGLTPPKDSSVRALCLVYPWGRSLDGKDDQRDNETPEENPGAVVVSLLEKGEAPWAMVTNGKLWRLYSQRTHSRATNYYEIDLEEVLAHAGPQAAHVAESFRYFWLFFRSQAFEPVEVEREGKTVWLTWLDQLLLESADYAKELGERLKDRVFEQVFPHLAAGFIKDIRERDGIDSGLSQEALEVVFQGTLTLLYRLLFLLYAEARDLLPVKEARGYFEVSLRRLKGEIAEGAGSIADEAEAKLKRQYRDDGYELYDRLAYLFRVVNGGNPALNVPVYNGGLFLSDPEEKDASSEAQAARFLNITKVPDRFLARALDLLARDVDRKRQDLVFIDYKSLGVRQLGSIYEGLLEFKLRIADRKLAIVKEKGREVYVPFRDLDGRVQERADRQGHIIRKGHPYLENDKRERKTTGSYYTPDHIVTYIVEHAVEPVLQEKFEAIRPKLREAQRQRRAFFERQEAFRKQGLKPEPDSKADLIGRELVDALFDLKILDPAMGSGHFLVEAVDYITDKALDFLNAFPWNPVFAHLAQMRHAILQEMDDQGITIDPKRLTDVNLLKRHVLKRCVYGVDLNPMAVELAKVSLWLDCFTLGAPLSFLDHHLRCGNSLIGVTAKEVREALEGRPGEPLQFNLFGSRFAGLLLATDLMRRVGELSDVTSAQVRESRAEYHRASDALAPFKRILDIYTSQWFADGAGTKPISSKSRKGASPSGQNNLALAFLKDPEAEAFVNARDEEALKAALTALPREFRQVAETALQVASEKRFLHWELEFPEVFYGPRPGTAQVIQRLEDAGFDAVIGNPPYVGFRDFEYDKDYVVNRFSCATARFDLYMPFLEHCVSIVRRRGFFAFICPSTFALREHGRGLRKVLLDRAALIRYHDFGDIAVFEGSQNYTCICVFQNESKTSKVAYSAGSSLSTPRLIEHRLTGDPWDFKLSASPLSSQKFRSITLPLEKLCSEINEGIVTGKNAAFARSEKFRSARSNELLRHLVEGQDVTRFLAEPSQYLLYTYRLIDGQTKVIPGKELEESFGEAYDLLLSHKDELKGRSYLSQTTKKWYELWRPREITAQARPKLVCPKLCSRATFALVDEGTYFLDTVYGIPTHRLRQYSASFLLATLNSQLTTCFLINVCPPKANSFFSNEREFLAQLPIRRIHFNTPEAERMRLAQELVALAAVMTAPEALQGSRDLRASPLGRALDELLPIDEAGEFLAFKPGATGAEERSDVVHDLLAHLAERMIDLNRQKHAEMKRFLGWLEAILHIHPGKDGKTGIETFSGKTTLKNYLGDYQKGQEHVPFDNLVDVLQRNKGRLSRPLDGAFEQWMRQEYEKSLALLLPIKEKLAATDWLIDQLVYRLYGLTDDEIAIVDGKL